MNKKIKLFVSDIDGTLTDSTVYYSKNGEELKQFSHRDGRAFHLLHHNSQCKTAWITSEKASGINTSRAYKLLNLKTLNYFYTNRQGIEKLKAIEEICKEEKIDISEVAYIGDDTNDFKVLEAVGIAGCPFDAVEEIINIEDIYRTSADGGKGAVREFVDYLFKKDLIFRGEEDESCIN